MDYPSHLQKQYFHPVIRKLVDIETNEIRALLWSFSCFFCLLCSYYILRPMRDEMGIIGGVENLHWVFTGTFLAILTCVPLFGWISSRFKRRYFLTYVYYFFILNLLGFYLLFKSNISIALVAQMFFIWVSVFNLFLVSLFWSFMTDIFIDSQARRLFGFIASGGTLGALAGPLLTAVLITPLGVENLLLISAAFLVCAVICIQRLVVWQGENSNLNRTKPFIKQSQSSEEPLGGGIFSGITLVLQSPYLIGIAILMLLHTTLSTFLYFQQAEIIRDSFADSATRTTIFASIDLTVNALTIIIQVFLFHRLLNWISLSWTLALVPIVMIVGFTFLATAPILSVLIILQVLRRSGNYAVMRPARELLYVVLRREQKYKAKNFNDTVVYRGGDAISAWAYNGLRYEGLNLSQIAWVAVPLAALWAWLAYKLGQYQNKQTPEDSSSLNSKKTKKTS